MNLLLSAVSSLNRGRRATAEKRIREAYRAICTPATEAEIEAARLFHQTDDVEVDMDALASHPDEKDDVGVWVQAWVWVGKPAGICRFPGCETVIEGDEVDLREHGADHEAGASGRLLERLRDDSLSFFTNV